MMLILAVIYVVFISLGLPDSLFGVAWPVVHLEFGIEESFASLYSIITGVASGGVSFLSGYFIRKFGTSRVTFVSILLTVAGLLGMSLSPNIIVMMVFAIILGYGAGVIDTGLNNFVSLHYKSHHMNFLHAFWGVGVTLSPLIMSLFLGDDGSRWRVGYRVVAGIQLAIAVAVFFTLKKWRQIEKNEIAEDAEEEKSASDKNPIEILKIKGVLPAILSLGFYCSMEFMLGTWGASYAVNVFAVPADEAAKWVSIYFGGIMVGRIIAGFISMKKSDKTLITMGVLSSFIGILVFALPLGKFSMLGFLLIGIGFGPIFPSVLHIIPERFGSAYSADITGFHMGGAYTVGFGMQLLYGFVATNTTFKITPYVLVALCFGLLLLNAYVNKVTKK